MRSLRNILLFLLATFGTSNAQDEAPKEKTLVEAKAEFAEADKALNKAYATTKKALSETEFKELQKDQRKWIEARDYRAKTSVRYDDRETPEGQEKKSPHYWETLKHLTDTRIAILRGWRGIGDQDTWTGRWIDGHGGLLHIVQEGKKIFYTLEVVRGPTYHSGFISGEAKKNENMARFSDAETQEPDKEKDYGETWLTFMHEGKWLELIGTNTQYYHGARAYFGGRYIRVAALSEKEAEQVLKDATNPDWPLEDEE